MSLNAALMFNQLAGLTSAAHANQWLQTQPVNEGSQNWWLWLLLLIILILLVWWLLQRETTPASTSQSKQSKGTVVTTPVKPAPAPSAPVTAATIAHLSASRVAPTITTTVAPPIAPPVVSPVAPTIPATPATMTEDLTKIEGIGPKINSVLQAAGIKTFADLSKTEVGQLRQILVGVGMKVNDPTTWPEQAGLAATGDWAGLRKLQEQLDGGRRV